MFLLAGTANAFAVSKAGLKIAPERKLETLTVSQLQKELLGSSCSVSVSSGSYKVSITISCDCTRRQACDAAYKLASIAL